MLMGPTRALIVIGLAHLIGDRFSVHVHSRVA
jgi:hypothetical protein